MKNTFLNRVSAERKVLAVVNEYTRKNLQLTGLSREAINNWREKVGFKHTQSIEPDLIELSELCQRLSDRSHETFRSLDESISAKVSLKIDDLYRSVSLWKQRLTIDNIASDG